MSRPAVITYLDFDGRMALFVPAAMGRTTGMDRVDESFAINVVIKPLSRQEPF